jgi:hypothetical protein
MTLEELKASIAAKFEAAGIKLKAEQARRRSIIWQRLAEWGITPQDGWTLEDFGWTVEISHPPELPRSLPLLLSGDNLDNVYAEHRGQVHSAEDVYIRLVIVNET